MYGKEACTERIRFFWKESPSNTLAIRSFDISNTQSHNLKDLWPTTWASSYSYSVKGTAQRFQRWGRSMSWHDIMAPPFFRLQSRWPETLVVRVQSLHELDECFPKQPVLETSGRQWQTTEIAVDIEKYEALNLYHCVVPSAPNFSLSDTAWCHGRSRFYPECFQFLSLQIPHFIFGLHRINVCMPKNGRHFSAFMNLRHEGWHHFLLLRTHVQVWFRLPRNCLKRQLEFCWFVFLACFVGQGNLATDYHLFFFLFGPGMVCTFSLFLSCKITWSFGIDPQPLIFAPGQVSFQLSEHFLCIAGAGRPKWWLAVDVAGLPRPQKSRVWRRYWAQGGRDLQQAVSLEDMSCGFISCGSHFQAGNAQTSLVELVD